MKRKMVVSNLRIPEENWLQTRTTAAELGLSVNEYINQLLDLSIKKKFLGIPNCRPSKKANKKTAYEAFWGLNQKKYKRKPMDVSEDDKIIYGIE